MHKTRKKTKRTPGAITMPSFPINRPSCRTNSRASLLPLLLLLLLLVLLALLVLRVRVRITLEGPILVLLLVLLLLVWCCCSRKSTSLRMAAWNSRAAETPRNDGGLLESGENSRTCMFLVPAPANFLGGVQMPFADDGRTIGEGWSEPLSSSPAWFWRCSRSFDAFMRS